MNFDANFLGNCVYNDQAIMFNPLLPEGGKMDKVTMEFIRTLNPKRVNNAALFCCNAKKDDKAIQQMKEALTAVGVKVLPETFVCSGKGLFGGKQPSEEELKEAAKWAKACAAKVSE